MEFDEDFLKEVGLSAMPEDRKQAFLRYVEDELEIRVGRKITEGLDRGKIDEFEQINDDEVALGWLRENKPNYTQIIDETIAELREEITKNKDEILA